MEIQLSDHFTYKKLIKFVLPSIVMMIFTSIYGVVDGLFVSIFFLILPPHHIKTMKGIDDHQCEDHILR